MQIKEIRSENLGFNLALPDNMPEIFADGFSSMMMAANHTKIVFHSVVDPQQDNQVEVRQGTLRLTMPTVTLLEMCRNILFNAQEKQDVLLDSGKQIDDQVKKILSGVTINNPMP